MDLHFLTFFALGMCFLSLWIYRSIWLWGSFLTISYILALQAGIAKPFSLIPIGTLFLAHLMLKNDPKGIQKIAVIAVAILISIGLSLHIIPGFCNWKIAERLWANFDKPFIGLFILAFQLPLLQSKQEWTSCLIKTIPLVIATLVLLFLLVNITHATTVDFTLPCHLLPRLAINLMFVVIPEEAFFRGFVQSQLFRLFGQGFKGGFLSILLTAIFFTLMHLTWGAPFALLGIVFAAGLIYGGVFQYTKMIEASILCHYAINVVHMMFFSYHA